MLRRYYYIFWGVFGGFWCGVGLAYSYVYCDDLFFRFTMCSILLWAGSVIVVFMMLPIVNRRRECGG